MSENGEKEEHAMAYEKLLNEIYAALSLEYLWPEYRPSFIKSESPDWINESMELGLEVSQALLPEDGQAGSFLEKYLGCLRSELPESAFSRYGERLYFYNDRFWAILPEEGRGQSCLYKAKYRFDRKLEKLNRNYRRCRCNALYLFLHPEKQTRVDAADLFAYMTERQETFEVRFDWVFLHCTNVIFVCDFQSGRMEEIPLTDGAGAFLAAEAERLRHDSAWAQGTSLEGYAIQVMRATELWQQTGAYYVRIHGMNRQHRIPLEREFDEHDGPDTRYLVLLDQNYPVGTCRLFPVVADVMEIGRVVVLETYRGRGLGKLLLREAEKWIAELGYTRVFLESRDVAVPFYEKLGYAVTGEPVQGETFLCVPMEKRLGGGERR
ncbi:MAG: GNAT family N-acetyltransferase [Lachnospiraceae bacterium]|nr:GNAT family N-acetyltransferase [Lachnospiraceae bacterium]